jgi:hypothetical protein
MIDLLIRDAGVPRPQRLVVAEHARPFDGRVVRTRLVNG